MTVNIYLNTVRPENCGATRVLDGSDNKVLGKVQPVQGSAAVFRDSLWHDGEEVRGGVKYLLRTDVMFIRDEPYDFDSLYADLGREEKARKALALAVRLEDGKNQQEALTWYRKAYRIWPDLDR
jgi:tetratricopeptide (TPR) repeat protein